MIYVPDNILKDIDNILFKYLWDNKPSKIKKTTLIAPIKECWFNMVDVFAVHTAAKCCWLKRILAGNKEMTWTNIMLSRLNITIEMLN